MSVQLKISKYSFLAFVLLCFIQSYAVERQSIWPSGKMPDTQSYQIAAMLDVTRNAEFDAANYRIPYIEWFNRPDSIKSNKACIVLISGGSYNTCCDIGLIKLWQEKFTKLGFQCVNLVYRTPRPEGLPIYQTAWEDGQRAIRIIRSESIKRGFDPEKIGVVSMSAGSHLGLLLSSSSQSKSYSPIDKLDSISCHINYAILHAPAYVTTDGESGTPSWLEGYGPDIKLSACFHFDEKTCPISLHHGGLDEYSSNGSTLIYNKLRKMNVPSELHLYPNVGHGAYGLERGIEFLYQIGIMGKLGSEEEIEKRYSSDERRKEVIKQDIWPERSIPNFQTHQCIPYIEWHFPKTLKTKSIQIIYSGGSYKGNNPDGFEVAPARRYLNELGMTVVTLRYRTPRPKGLAKHITAWEDLQRTIRVVRSQAEIYGLDPKQIGIMGSSAGGHLTLLGVTSSLHKSYLPIDEIDNIPCNVQWGICMYPAYVLTDGIDGPNTYRGNANDIHLVSDFSFDIRTVPTLFIHGDADGYSAMGSVRVWERMKSMGVQSELHILALRDHCFQRKASPKTGSYTWLERISDFLTSLEVL
ncbi:alpha/beta hydrolase [Bacteroides sp.]|uniref:alpha/beta hydrolase n=1 Tax=Bacteroides sp. TaxID=29523 RepID=UPI002582CA91|nr:alpha/beta hydrolase [Bacteroides sp.]